MPSNHLILCRPLLLLPSIFPRIRVFSNELAKVLELQLQHQPFGRSGMLRFMGLQRVGHDWATELNWTSNEYSGLVSSRIDWFDLLAVQGTLKSLLQHHSSKASIFWHTGFFMVQLSHLYMTTGKTVALTIQTFVRKVMSLLFNMLSSLVIAFLSRSKCLLISWLQSPSAVILEAKKMKSVTVSIVYPSICHEVMGPDAMILVFWKLSYLKSFLRKKMRHIYTR